MDASTRSKLAARGLITPDSAGRDAVRVYLQYLPNLSASSGSARGKALRKHFERTARKRGGGWVELDPQSLSESGQLIEATVPIDKYEQVAREFETENVRVGIVEPFKVS